MLTAGKQGTPLREREGNEAGQRRLRRREKKGDRRERRTIKYKERNKREEGWERGSEGGTLQSNGNAAFSKEYF